MVTMIVTMVTMIRFRPGGTRLSKESSEGSSSKKVVSKGVAWTMGVSSCSCNVDFNSFSTEWRFVKVVYYLIMCQLDNTVISMVPITVY